MSKKRNRSRRNRVVRAADHTAEAGNESIMQVLPGLFASDGFTNQMAYIGEASELMKAGTYERKGITNNIELLTVMYR